MPRNCRREPARLPQLGEPGAETLKGSLLHGLRLLRARIVSGREARAAPPATKAFHGNAEEETPACLDMPNQAYDVTLPDAGALKPMEWMGSSRDDLRALPDDPRALAAREGASCRALPRGRQVIMAKRKAAPEIPVTCGSGNVYADLGFENPAEELAKAQLAMMLDDAR